MAVLTTVVINTNRYISFVKNFTTYRYKKLSNLNMFTWGLQALYFISRTFQFDTCCTTTTNCTLRGAKKQLAVVLRTAVQFADQDVFSRFKAFEVQLLDFLLKV